MSLGSQLGGQPSLTVKGGAGALYFTRILLLEHYCGRDLLRRLAGNLRRIADRGRRFVAAAGTRVKKERQNVSLSTPIPARSATTERRPPGKRGILGIRVKSRTERRPPGWRGTLVIWVKCRPGPRTPILGSPGRMRPHERAPTRVAVGGRTVVALTWASPAAVAESSRHTNWFRPGARTRE